MFLRNTVCLYLKDTMATSREFLRHWRREGGGCFCPLISLRGELCATRIIRVVVRKRNSSMNAYKQPLHNQDFPPFFSIGIGRPLIYILTICLLGRTRKMDRLVAHRVSIAIERKNTHSY